MRVRLLGPCFKTGRIGCRRGRHRPCAHPGEAARGEATGGRTTLQAVPPSRNRRQPPNAPRGRRVTLGPPSRPTSDVCNTEARRLRLPSAGAHDGPGTGRGAPPTESAPLGPHQRGPPFARTDDPTAPRGTGPARLNSAGGLCGPIRLPLNGFTYS